MSQGQPGVRPVFAHFQVSLLDERLGTMTVYVGCDPDQIDRAAENIRQYRGYAVAVAFATDERWKATHCVGITDANGWWPYDHEAEQLFAPGCNVPLPTQR